VGEERRDCTAVTPSHYVERPISINPNAHDWGAWTTATPSFIEEREETRICSHDNSHEETRAVDQKHITSATDWSDAFGELNNRTGDYTLTIGGDFSIAGTTTDTITGTPAGGLTVTLKGSGTVSLSSSGHIIRVSVNQTIIIDSEHLTLQGRNGNDNPVLRVYAGGTLELQNGTISGNTNSSASANSIGGGVQVSSGSTFTITGGTISGNTGYQGGGVYVNSGSFTMMGGTISGNTATGGGGGGVRLAGGTFRIVNGTVYGSSEGALSNIGSPAALSNGGTAQRGTFSGATWNNMGSLTDTNTTIRVVDGVLE
jgi:hypothetical protein